jgi:hypothetical protein
LPGRRQVFWAAVSVRLVGFAGLDLRWLIIKQKTRLAQAVYKTPVAFKAENRLTLGAKVLYYRGF